MLMMRSGGNCWSCGRELCAAPTLGAGGNSTCCATWYSFLLKLVGVHTYQPVKHGRIHSSRLAPTLNRRGNVM